MMSLFDSTGECRWGDRPHWELRSIFERQRGEAGTGPTAWEHARIIFIGGRTMLDTRTTWLSDEELATARERLPIVYVDAVPVRVDVQGMVTEVGLLLRAMPDGAISRAVVSGRVLYGERVRDALVRHLEKDLGPMALPRIPASPQPFTIVEYFPDPGLTGFHDPRQHAVSLAYIVPIDGECAPSQDALDLVWVSPGEAVSPEFQGEMSGGQGRLVRAALAHCGVLP